MLTRDKNLFTQNLFLYLTYGNHRTYWFDENGETIFTHTVFPRSIIWKSDFDANIIISNSEGSISINSAGEIVLRGNLVSSDLDYRLSLKSDVGHKHTMDEIILDLSQEFLDLLTSDKNITTQNLFLKLTNGIQRITWKNGNDTIFTQTVSPNLVEWNSFTNLSYLFQNRLCNFNMMDNGSILLKSEIVFIEASSVEMNSNT